MHAEDYFTKPGRTYRGKSGTDRVLVSIEGTGEVVYRRAGESDCPLRSCWISTWLGWCKELLPETTQE